VMRVVVGVWRQGRDGHLVGVSIEHQFQATDAAPVDDTGARRVIARRRKLLTDRVLHAGHFQGIGGPSVGPVPYR
jgi:hypothetical protein